MMTYRYRGHSMSDPAQYRTREEVEQMRKEHDPIERVRERLIASGRVKPEQLKSIDEEVRAIIVDAVAFAESSPEPDATALWTDLLV